MTFSESSAIARPVIRTVVVPTFLYEASKRVNMSLMELTDFGKLRQIASLEQVAVFAALNTSLSIDGTMIANNRLRDIMTLGAGSDIEMRAVFSQMALTKEVEDLTHTVIGDYPSVFEDMLALKQNKGIAKVVPDSSLQNTLGNSLTDKWDLPYQLKTSGSNVFVIVGSGFNKYVGAPRIKEKSLTFVRDFLELCSGLFSPSEVARHPLFKSFIYTLAA